MNVPSFTSRRSSIQHGPPPKYSSTLQFFRNVIDTLEAPDCGLIHVSKEKRLRDRLMRERDKALLRGKLLRAKLDAATHELDEFRNLLERQRKRNKMEMEILLSTRIAPPKKRVNSMASLVGRSPHRVDVGKQHEEAVNQNVGDYRIQALLGEGGYGKVYSGIHSKTMDEYAIKMFRKSSVQSVRHMMDVELEVAVMRFVNHPNVVRLHEVIHSPNHISLVMDLGHLDLYSWIEYQRNMDNDISSRVYREIILGIVKPIEHLHAIGIAHLDLKEFNVLVTKDVSVHELSQEHIKLCDFGLCTISSSDEGIIEESGMIGTRGYFAPEMASDEDYDARAADMFSLGCTLLNIIDRVPREWMEAYRSYKTSRTSFQKQMRVLLMVLFCDDNCFEGLHYPIVEIIRSLLKFDPNKRLTAAEVLQHPWLVE